MRAFVLLTLLVPAAVVAGDESQSSRPTVVLILADDMAVGDLSALNGGRTRTPHLDRMLDEGLWFDAAYSASPVCAPARAALLTGRFPHRTGVVTLNMNRYPRLTRLHPDETTIATVLARAGYRTGLVGKWHTGIGAGEGPIRRGFQEFAGFHGSNETAYFRFAIQTDDRMAREPAETETYLTDELTERAIAFVRRHAESPFFLHLAHYAPHRPLEAPEPMIRRYQEAGHDRETATVYAMIEAMDAGIGRLLGEIDRLGLRERTLVLFASDNGPDPLVPRRFNLGLPGGKYEVAEGGIRVPLIARWPGTIEPGTRGEVVHFTDLFPTLVELCKAEHAGTLDGTSLGPLLRGDGRFASPPRYWQWNRGTPNHTHNAALRVGSWKLVRPFVTRGLVRADSTVPHRLYQVGVDPYETTDLADRHPERVAAMREAMARFARALEADRLRPSSASANDSR